MDWYDLISHLFSLDSAVVGILVTLATFMTYIVHRHFDTDIYVTVIVFAVMLLAAMLGHLTFFMNDIIFTHEPGRNALIGASIATSIAGFVGIVAYGAIARSMQRGPLQRGPTQQLTVNRKSR